MDAGDIEAGGRVLHDILSPLVQPPGKWSGDGLVIQLFQNKGFQLAEIEAEFTSVISLRETLFGDDHLLTIEARIACVRSVLEIAKKESSSPRWTPEIEKRTLDLSRDHLQKIVAKFFPKDIVQQLLPRIENVENVELWDWQKQRNELDSVWNNYDFLETVVINSVRHSYFVHAVRCFFQYEDMFHLYMVGEALRSLIRTGNAYKFVVSVIEVLFS
jgi:hypothetical protein